tara:strand:- start:134830 stop:134970 length:141 start_codon:yes stop_codon:yes gene_type:complete
MKQNLLRRRPDATEAERREMLQARLLNTPLQGVPFEARDRPETAAG